MESDSIGKGKTTFAMGNYSFEIFSSLNKMAGIIPILSLKHVKFNLEANKYRLTLR